MNCEDCIYYSNCFELRGPCREFKTLNMIRREIVELNENFKKTAARTAAGDKAADTPESLWRRDMDS